MPKHGRFSETQTPYRFSEASAFDLPGFQIRLRQAIGTMSVNKFAEKGEGISESNLRKYLSGTIPRLDKATAIASASGVSLDWLATGQASHEKDAAEPAPASEDMMVLMLDVVEGLGQHLQERGVTQMVPPHKHRMLVELIAREMIRRQKAGADESTNVVDISDFRKLVDLAVSE